ncbi:hypothetical protein [uncultured Dokdonia sp.]|uniref:hypothetical protein n=1 Tax=uncultured Dokdonia sp. TaxID=575653 RepID=UPI0026378715|nr:hypothetical protein [uncultured Dokdonia sp.]
MNKEILNQDTLPNTERRRDLLPIWIKVFLWFFMIFGFFAPICLLLGILGFDVSLALYGLEATNALTVNGLNPLCI